MLFNFTFFIVFNRNYGEVVKLTFDQVMVSSFFIENIYKNLTAIIFLQKGNAAK